MEKRKIKFRAWDSSEKIMTVPVMAKLQDGEWVSPPDSILMQSTCLFDKNSKEIYEDDILSIGGHPWVCTWHKQKAKFGMTTRNTFNTKQNAYFFKSVEYGAKKGKVIGNIHQNPELLK